MRKTMHKLFWVWEYDKEEKWLNEMAARGLALVGIGFCKYVFEETAPGEYAIRLELLNSSPSTPQSEAYLHFVEDTGAEYIGSLLRWVYFRKKRSSGEFDLYSDINSRIAHLNRILILLGVLGSLELFCGVNNTLLYSLGHGMGMNLYVGLFCLAFGFFITYGFIRIFRKKLRLQKDKILFE